MSSSEGEDSGLRCDKGHCLKMKLNGGTNMFESMVGKKAKHCHVCNTAMTKKGDKRHSCKPCKYHLCDPCFDELLRKEQGEAEAKVIHANLQETAGKSGYPDEPVKTIFKDDDKNGNGQLDTKNQPLQDNVVTPAGKSPSSAVEIATPTESEIAPCPIRLEVSLKTELKGIDADAHEVGLAPAAVVSGVSAGDRVVGSGRLRPTGAYRSSRARIPIRSDQLPRRTAPALPAASDGMMDSHLASEGDRSDHEPESTPPEGI